MSIARLSNKEQWELFIPQMGYMALLRNLRNFDDADIPDSFAKTIGEKLSSPYEVKTSKQFPYAFHSAWMNVPSPRWKKYLDEAVNLSVPNIPQLDGRNLILVDTSGSMTAPMTPPTRTRKTIDPSSGLSQRYAPKTPSRMGAAALFGIALGVRNSGNVDLFSFADGQEDLTALTTAPEGILAAMDIFEQRSGIVGHGTQIAEAVKRTYQGQERVFIFTDMQSMPHEGEYAHPSRDITHAVPADKHVYGFNLAGYTNSAMNTGVFRHEMGGLTDATFSLVKNIESGVSGEWPWT
jgi:hypothetical protein